jgi:dinuclear metal center YbgI/SA1388 family protein
MRLIRAGVSLYAAHTTFDRAAGGINDMLAGRLGLVDVVTAAGPEDGLMRVGALPEAMAEPAFFAHVKRALGADSLRVSAWPGGPVRTVAVLGGSGGDFAAAAKEAGADALVTGEAKHHHFLEAQARGLLLVEAGHYATEHGFVDEIFMSLQSRRNELQLFLDFEKAKCEKAPVSSV